jgi:hypothetical protein
MSRAPSPFRQSDLTRAIKAYVKAGRFVVSIDVEYVCRSRLKWQHDGSDWVLWCGRRRMGRVVPDAEQPGMYRSEKAGRRSSNIANLSWTKDAVLAAAIRELEWSARTKAANDPSKSPENEGSFKGNRSSFRANDLAATPTAGRLA